MSKEKLMLNIRENTKDLHAMAESTGFIKRLFAEKASKDSYAEYLFNLCFIYKTIEEEMDKNKDNEVIKPFIYEELKRGKAIEKDLELLLGEKMKEIIPLKSTEVFVNRLREVSKMQPELLVAHAYTRYLADLFGGRQMFSLMEDYYKVDREALNYHVFEGIKDIKSFVGVYHNKLNEISLPEELQDKFLNEVNLTYLFNVNVSEEMEFKLNKSEK